MKNSLLLLLSSIFILSIPIQVVYSANIIIFLPMILLLPFFRNPFPLEMKYIYLLSFFMFILLFWSVLNLEFYSHASDYYNNLFRRKAFFRYLVFLFIVLFYVKRKELFIKSINNALFIIVLLWYVQLIGFYITGEYLDLSEPFLGADYAQRYQAYFIQSSLPIEIIRPTSVFQEPGTYAMSTFPLLVLSYVVRQYLTKLHIVTLISFICSLSLFGIMIAILFLLSVEISNFKFEFTKRNIFLLIIFSLLSVGLLAYLYFRFVIEGGIEQVGYREVVLSFWMGLNISDVIFGLGYAQTVFANRTIINDTTFLFKLIFEYGIFALPYLFLMAYISRGLAIFFLLIILLTKINYQTYTMWLFTAGMILLWKNSDEVTE